jgi:hypothetical protein
MRLMFTVDGGEVRFFTFSSEEVFWLWYNLLMDIKSYVAINPTFQDGSFYVGITTKNHPNFLGFGNFEEEARRV